MMDHERDTQVVTPIGHQEPSLLSRAVEMRNAIDLLEGALMGCGRLIDMPDTFDGCADDMVICPKLKLGEVRRVRNALMDCTRIINSDDFHPRALSALAMTAQQPAKSGGPS